jgi:preprotein translocase subunit YajC
MVVLLVGMMFFSTRSQKKKQKEMQNFINELSVGDTVMTQSGLIGKIRAIDKEDGTAVISSEGSLSRWLTAALTQRPGQPTVESGSDEVEDDVEDSSTKEINSKEEYEVEYEDIDEKKDK